MTPLWRNRDFTALWTGQVVSSLGTRVSGTAAPLLVLAVTGSPADAGLVGAAGTLPYLIAHLPAGPLIDRWDRRRVLRAATVTGGAAAASIPAAMWWGTLTVTHLALVAFVQGLCFVFFDLAEHATLPAIVPAAQLPTALARNEARGRGAALAGPPLGGLLFGLGRAWPFVADTLSYAAAAAALLLLLRPTTRPTTQAEPLWRATTTGLRWIWRHPLIRAAILLVAASNFVFEALTLVTVVLARRQGATAAGIGVMLGLASGGGLLGALAAARLHHHLTPKAVIIGVNWIWVVLLPPLVVAGPLQIGGLRAASAFVGPLWNVVIVGYATLLVPDHLRGRVFGASMALAWGVMPLASLAAGYLLTTAGPVAAVWALTAVMLATAVAATVSPAVRHAPALTPRPAADPAPAP